MSNPTVVVVGAGMAGTAAAYAAVGAGAAVTLVHDGAGATALTSGALDLEAWDGALSFAKAKHERDAGRDDELALFLAALGIYQRGGAEPKSTAMVATASGAGIFLRTASASGQAANSAQRRSSSAPNLSGKPTSRAALRTKVSYGL